MHHVAPISFIAPLVGGGYVIEGSGLFDRSGSGHLAWTPSGSGDNTDVVVLEVIFKLGSMETGTDIGLLGAGTTGANPRTAIEWNNNALTVRKFNGSTNDWILTMSGLIYDYSAFYHLIVAIDTSQGVASDRVKVWLNGTQVSDFSTETYPSLNADTDFATTDVNYIGRTFSGTAKYFDGCIARAAVYDNLTITDPETDGFGTTVGNGWQIKDVSGLTFGTNGFLIEGGTNMAAGTDSHTTGSATSTFTASSTAYQAGAPTNWAGNFDGISIGTASADRVVVVAISGNNGSTGVPSAVTIAGNSATLAGSTYVGGESDSSIWYATVATGTTADIDITYSSGKQSVSIGVYAITGCNPDPLDTSGSTTADTPSTTITAHSGSTLIACASHAVGSGSTTTWTGPTEDYDEDDAPTSDNCGFTSASADYSALQDEITVTASCDGTAATSSMACAVWEASGTNHFLKTGTITATNDSPTNSTDGSGTYGNYANFNDEYQIGSTAYNNATYSQGNTHATYANGEGSVLSQAVALGNGIYFEATLTTPFGSTFYDTVGFIDPTRYASTITNIQESPATGYSFFKSNGQKSDDGATLASYGSAWDTAGKVIGVYISPTGKVWYTIDGTLQNSATESEVVNDTGTSHAFTLSGFGQILPVLSARGSNTVWDLNCGQFAWNTTPYSGYAGLSTANTPAPTVTDMSEHYQTELVAHDGSSTAFTLNWNPQTYDTLFILKNRAGGSEDWFHINTLRGVNKILKAWDTTGGTETTDANVLSISGTTVTLGSTLANANYVVYCFRAGAAGGATNTNGTINSTVSVNPTTGFTLGTFQGTGANGTVGHGSDAALDWLHLRHLNGTVTAGPYAYHSSVGATKALYPNTTSAATTDSTIWNNTAPTATVFSVGSSSNINQNTKDFLFWGFPKKSGAFFAGEMTGNASADGPVFHIDDGGAGGIASMFCIKRHDAGTENWQIIDTARDTYNAADLPIFPNAIVAEGSATFSCDINSNNIKMRSATTDNNTSSGKYAIWGVIEYPFGGEDVAQAKAR